MAELVYIWPKVETIQHFLVTKQACINSMKMSYRSTSMQCLHACCVSADCFTDTVIWLPSSCRWTTPRGRTCVCRTSSLAACRSWRYSASHLCSSSIMKLLLIDRSLGGVKRYQILATQENRQLSLICEVLVKRKQSCSIWLRDTRKQTLCNIYDRLF